MRNNQEAHRAGGRVADLVTSSRQDVDTASGGEQVVLSIHFHQNFTIQNVEELLRMFVVVADLG